jgi:cytochrome P450
LKDIFDNPEAWSEHIRRYSISVARSISYGQRVAASGDGFQRDISQLMANFSKAMTPGRYIVEALPSLSYLPSLLQPWMKELREIRDYERTSNLNNFKKALQDAEKHPDRPCIARDIQTTIETRSDSQDLQSATTCNEILGTASETTANSLLFTVMASINFPDCVRKAQEELDRVIGRSRLPTWEDEANLPYIRAFVKEQHRWRTVAPLGNYMLPRPPSIPN